MLQQISIRIVCGGQIVRVVDVIVERSNVPRVERVTSAVILHEADRRGGALCAQIKIHGRVEGRGCELCIDEISASDSNVSRNDVVRTLCSVVVSNGICGEHFVAKVTAPKRKSEGKNELLDLTYKHEFNRFLPLHYKCLILLFAHVEHYV